MAAKAEEPQLVQPFGDRVALSATYREGRVKPQTRAPRGRIVITHSRHSESHSRFSDRPEVLLVDARVTDRLPLDEGTVAKQVGEQHDFVVLPGCELMW